MICLFGDDEQEFNEHEIAWMSKDWDAIQKLSDSFKEKPESELFMLLNNINMSKQEINVDNIDSYSKFMIDQMLSKHVDCIQEAFVANMFLHGLSDQAHYNYMINSISRGKLFAKSTKLDESYKDKFMVLLLAKFYSVSYERATEYKKLLERKSKLSDVLNKCKGFVTDEFIKTVTKNVKEQKELKKLL